MTTDILITIAALLVIGLVWLLVNLRAGSRWLAILSLIGTVGFIGLASFLALSVALP